jgi:hypothetical protein
MLVCNPVFTINQLKSEEFRSLIAVADSQLKVNYFLNMDVIQINIRNIQVPADYKAFKTLINDSFTKKQPVESR